MTEQVIHRDPQFTEELLNSAKAGDRDALAALYEGTHQEIYRTIHAMVRDEDLTMDIQQDSYIHAFTHLDQLRNASSFLPWLRRVAVNEARMQLRKKKPLLFTEYVSEEGEEPEIPDVKPETSPELALDRKETARLVGEILDGLSDLQRMLVGMYYYEEIPIRQIAEDLNINQGTARSLLSRSRKKIEAAVRNLEKKGIRLYGLTPIPFLISLLKQSAPPAASEAKALPAILNSSGAGQTVAIHVGRRFFETALGKAALGVLAACTVGGGILGYGYIKNLNEHASLENLRIEILQPEQTDVPDTTQPEEHLITPVQPPVMSESPEETILPVPNKEPDVENPPSILAVPALDPSQGTPTPTIPLVTESSASEPHVADPPVTRPPASEPPVTEPGITDLPPADPTQEAAPETEAAHPEIPEATPPNEEDTEPAPSASIPTGEDSPEDLSPLDTGADSAEDLELWNLDEIPATEPTPTEILRFGWDSGRGFAPWSEHLDASQGHGWISVKAAYRGDWTPEIYSDNPDVIDFEEGYGFSGSSLLEGELGYCWRTKHVGFGTATVYCVVNGVVTNAITFENPPTD